MFPAWPDCQTSTDPHDGASNAKSMESETVKARIAVSRRQRTRRPMLYSAPPADPDSAMKIAIPTTDDRQVSGHAGQARHWLVYDCRPGEPIPGPVAVTLAKEQVLHHFKDDGPHPLDGVEVVVAGSAGDGFLRHMQKRGAQVLLTAEKDPAAAIRSVLVGEALPDPRWDPSLLLCKLKDLFSRH